MTTAGRLKTIYWDLHQRMKRPGASVSALIAPTLCRIARRNPEHVFAVDIRNDKLGFFANLNICLRLLHFCEAGSLTPYIAFSSQNYLDTRHGPNWFDYFFEVRKLTPLQRRAVECGDLRLCRVSSGDELGIPAATSRDFHARIDLQTAHDLFGKHIAIRPQILDEVDRFVGLHFDDEPVLGVHFRGTDKQAEAPRVAWDRCRATVENFLAQHPEVQRIFVASDEEAFIDRFRREFTQVRVIERADSVRSTSDKSIHLDHGTGTNYGKGEDALTNCLLMARCSTLIKSASLLSGWASVFNPRLPVVLLNRPHRPEDLWFPENRIAERSQQQYLPDERRR